MHDILFALRGFRRSPGVVVTVVVTVGLALGLNTTMFSIFNAYVLRPFDVRDPYGIYNLAWATKHGRRNPTFAEFDEVRARSSSISTAFVTENTQVTIQGQPFMAQRVSANYFSTLGVGAMLGRILEQGDAREMVISSGAWKAKFGSDPTILGRSFPISGNLYTIVGIARAGFEGVTATAIDLWIPQSDSHPRPLNGALVRIKPGLSAREAQAELSVLGASLTASEAPDQRAIGAELTLNATPLALAKGANYIVFAPLFVAFGLILVIACANVANVLLARAAGREREIAIRLALGAGRARIVRQLLIESVLLAIPAALAAFIVAQIATRSALQLYSSLVPNLLGSLIRILPLDPDMRVFGFLLAAALASTFAFGLAPAIHAARASVNFRRARLRNALVVSQVAVCVLLLIVSGILLRGNSTLQHYDPGFNPHNIFDFELQNSSAARAVEELRIEPWAEIAAAATRPPMGDVRTIPIGPADGATIRVGYNFVTPEFFDVLRIPVVRGRAFAPDQANAEAPVAIVSESTARQFWPGRDAVGQVIRIEPQLGVDREAIPAFRRAQVIGVVRDIATADVFTPITTPIFYFPTHAGSAKVQELLIRVKQDTGETRRTMFEAMDRLAPGAAKVAFSMDEFLGVELFPLRMSFAIAGFLGILALVLAVSGVYGVLSYLVAQRMREIGIRMALGASIGAVVRLVLGHSARFALWGIGIGGLMALGVSKLFASLFEEINTYEPLAYLVAICAVFLAAMAAAYVPSIRAARVDPASTLRHD